MSTRLTTEEYIKKARQKHGNRYDYSKTVYVRSRDKVTIICPKHGQFEQQAASHLMGSGCPVCQKEWSVKHKTNHAAATRKARGMTTEEWIRRAKEIHGDKYDYSQTVYVNSRTDVTIICPKHGPFTQKADSHLRGCGCKKCGQESENHIGKHSWSEEQRTKTVATCIARYGASRYLDSAAGKAKVAEIKSDPAFRAKMHDIIASDEVQGRTKATCMSRYGKVSAMSLSETVDKVHETKIKNHSWNTSKPEENMYVALCEVFGETDVVRQYKDLRYPFRCDFYIKSLDLFIELNGTWLHGGRWFDDTDPTCVEQLKQWQTKVDEGHRFYTVAIDVWTGRDVRKRETAVQNGLNYLVFWQNDLADFYEWLKMKPLLLKNIE